MTRRLPPRAGGAETPSTIRSEPRMHPFGHARATDCRRPRAVRRRLSHRGSVLLVGSVLALGAAGCGGSHSAAAPAAAATAPSASPSAGPPGVSGTAAAVTATSVQVQNPATGQTRVDLTPSTVFTQTVPATSADLAVGSCVVATGTPATPGAAAGVVTVQSVTITPAGPDGCTGGFLGGAGGAGGAGRSPGATRSPRPTAGPGTGADRGGAFGKVTSLSAPTFVVEQANRTTGATRTTTVTWDATTAFTKVVPAAASALSAGQCVNAAGPTDDTGAISATTVNIRPPGPTGCATGQRRGAGPANAGTSGSPAANG